MKEPVWINLEDCLAFHDGLLARFGGLAGVRDEGLLHSALNRPQQLLNYEKPTLHQIAACYAYGIAKNHPFLDGNKRSALMACAMFLECNGFVFTASEEDAILQTLGLAASEVSEAEYADWLKANSKKRK